MKKVAIYVRSSKDLHNVSCKAQEDQIRKVVKEKGEQVYRVFCDKYLSSTRDIRPEFDEMLGLAMTKQSPFPKIYCLDTSRFGRDQHQTQSYLWALRKKYGIEVIFTSMPQTNTYIDSVFETIMSAFDELHSQQSKVKGVAGMKQNVKSGYRAGGKAPYGYRLKKIEVGKHRTGNPITKTKLEPDPDTAQIAKEYFERRAKYENRRAILDDFYVRDIPSPSGNRRWSAHSAKSIEDNIEVYLGHTVFNRHNERIKEKGKANGYLHGKKFKPKEEWVITENTHEPLITEDIAYIIKEIKKKRIWEAPITQKRVYALSGTMKCSECGTNYAGDRGIYRCNSRTKPGDKCPNNDISQITAEDAIFTLVSQKILNFKNVKGVIDRVKKRFQNGMSDIQPLEKNLAKIEKQQQKYMDLYSRGLVEIEDIEPKLASIKEQKKAIVKKIENQKVIKGAFEVSDDDIRSVIKNFSEEISHADPKVRKSAILALFEQIKIFPKENEPWERMLEIKGSCLPLTRVSVASPRGFEPLLPA
ncbi:MAG: hypothetical protein SRB2_04838 [Desulfobacteraceae bacterium Eth-SRB2]|nr:MAG: hypothetical protein SRB2_04838 [Desulfobacteraceae bacterium Eth-SRB2]